MDPIAMVFGLALFAGAVFFVVSPFRSSPLQKISAGQSGQRKGSLKLSTDKKRQAVLLALRDLDFDYQAAKISDEDYQTLRADLLNQAAQLMQGQERMKDDALEALIQFRRNGRPEPQKIAKGNEAGPTEKLCRNCQAPLQDDAKFCSKCGTSVANAVCPKCGQSVSADDHFCPACGTTIQPSTEHVHS